MAKAREAAARLAADLKRYRAGIVAAPDVPGKAAMLAAVDRQAAAARELRRALTRYATGRGGAAAVKAIARASRKLAAAERSGAKASRALLP